MPSKRKLHTRAAALVLSFGLTAWPVLGHVPTGGELLGMLLAMAGLKAQHDYPAPLRRIGYRDPETGKALVFLTNNFTVPALTIAQLYRSRWQIELFFKWIKQHLRIKKFYGNSENAVRSQIWIAIAVYVLVAIIKKRLNLDASLYTLLQILSVTLFEKMPLQQAFPAGDCKTSNAPPCK